MHVAVPRESSQNEHRVGLTPFAVAHLVANGHRVYVEHDAGADSHFSDEDYRGAGAQVVYSADEACGRAQLVGRIGPPRLADVERLQPGTVVAGLVHLAVAPADVIAALQARRITVLGYELIEDEAGQRPVLGILGEIAGQMTVHVAAHLLEYESGGRGLLLGGIAGIPPATAVVLGAGRAGSAAARSFARAGAHVIVLDNDVARLDRLLAVAPELHTSLATPRHVRRFTAIADIVVGAVFLPGGRVPWLVTEDMVAAMKPGSVIVDLSIDQGGCVETSRPTTLRDPTFEVHGVLHYCVPNMTANTPRVSSRAVSMGVLHYLEALTAQGLEGALRGSRSLAGALYFYRGRAVHPVAAKVLGLEYAPLSDLLASAATGEEVL